MKQQWNPPPGWPTPPPNWRPQPGWKPDPSWPPAPAGWDFGTPKRRSTGKTVGLVVGSIFGLLVLTGIIGAVFGSTTTRPTAEQGTPAPSVSTSAPTPAPTATTDSPAAQASSAPTSQPSAAPAAPGQAGEPNRQLTPGDVFVGATRDRICVSGYTTTVRYVTSSTRQAVFTAYQISYPPPAGAFELDHLIPLELGGSNTAGNLWPQVYHGAGSADVKDRLENHLHALVCSGQVPLTTAQQAIASDWRAAATRYNPIAVTTSSPPQSAPAQPPTTGTEQTGVHAGAFCAPSGAQGTTTKGTAVVCSTTPNSPDRARWHSP